MPKSLLAPFLGTRFPTDGIAKAENGRFMPSFLRRGPGLLLALAVVTGCASAVNPAHGTKQAVPGETASRTATVRPQTATALDLNALLDLDRVVARLADKRVVFVGERHDRYEHHLVQLEIIRQLHALHPQLAIGMEMFQQPFQRHLDAYTAGTTGEQTMLRDTEYYARWRLDFRLYAPILRYAREHQLPVVALNLPQELTRKVGRKGLEALSQEETVLLPSYIDRSDSEYRQRLRSVFDTHPKHNGQDNFERFLQVQLLWDEGMAERAAVFLDSHPDHKLVVLAGNGHLAYGSGIPQRLLRRLPVSSAIVLNGWQGEIEPGLADFLLLPEKRSLPRAGKLGAILTFEQDVIKLLACSSGSACETAGLKKHDEIISINDQPVRNRTDLRLALWDKKPGDRIKVDIRRKRFFRPAEQLSYELELQEGR